MVRAGQHGERERSALDNNFVTIEWDELGDLSKIDSRDELKELMKDAYPDGKKRAIASYAGQVWAFIKRIEIDDLVALPLKTQSAIAIGRIKGDYEYRTDLGEDIHNIRKVNWIRKDIPRTDFDQDLRYSLGAFMTVCQISRNNAEERIRKMLKIPGKPKMRARGPKMESIFNTMSIKNFKSLRSIKDLNLRPITLLVGANSSGKTAVLQTILMLKQTLESRNIDAPLILRGKYVDFNSYRDIIFKHERNRNIEIELNIKLDKDRFKGYENIKNIIKINLGEILNSININYTFGYDKKTGTIRNKSFEIFHRNILKAVYKGENVLDINCLDSVIPYETKNEEMFEIKNIIYMPITDRWVHRRIMEHSSYIRRMKTLEKRIIGLNEEIGQMTLNGEISKGRQMNLEQYDSELKFYQSDMAILNKRIKEILGNYDISEIQIIDFILKLIKESMLKIQEILLERTYYIGPLRTFPQRYYFTSGERPRDVGLEGENTIDVIFYGFLSNKERSEKLSYWMKKMELAETIQLEPITEGIYTLLVEDPNLNIKVTLAEIGFGASQVLPIIVEGFYARENSLLLIEQPEIHLHPKLQSTLCDLIIDIVKENKQVIVETHSEHLILRLQRRIAENVISHKDVSLLYFETSKNGTVITDIELNESGMLTTWPKGFFEEDLEESMLYLKALGEREK